MRLIDVQYEYRRLRGAMSRYRIRTDYDRVIRGVRQDPDEPVSVRDVRDALTVVYPDLVFVGWTAAALHGARYTSGRPPEIHLPRWRRRSGVLVRTGVLPPEDITEVAGRRATTGVRTAIDLARTVEGDEAIAAVDRCLRLDGYGRSVTTIAEIRAYLDTHPRLHRGRRIRAVLAEAAVGADSPWETYTRLALHRSGLRMFVPQRSVRGTEYHVDLGADEFRVGVEYDGAPHRTRAQHLWDVRRLGAIDDAGWAVIPVTAGVLRNDRRALLARIAAKLRERGWDGPAPTVPDLDLPEPPNQPDQPEPT